MIQPLHIQTGQSDIACMQSKTAVDVQKSETAAKGFSIELQLGTTDAVPDSKSFLAVLEKVTETAMEYATEEVSQTNRNLISESLISSSQNDQETLLKQNDVDTLLMDVFSNTADEDSSTLLVPSISKEMPSVDMEIAENRVIDKKENTVLLSQDDLFEQIIEYADEQTGKKTKKASRTEQSETETPADVQLNGMLPRMPEQTIQERQFEQNAALLQHENGSDTLAKMNISVRDERTKKDSIPDTSATFTHNVNYTADNTAEMTLTFAGKTANQIQENASILSTDTAKSAQFETLLSSELRANANELVKTGAIVLKDNNTGSINLTLRPEELGNVKINLELSDKHIVGKIIVSSEEAYNAFKQNLQGIKEAFIAGGFDSAGFELTLAGSLSGNGEGRQNADKHAQQNERALFYASAIPQADDELHDEPLYTRSSLNVLA